ncbi:MAG TPA: hypothetical protein VJB87_00095 [Candidatus Nanoarchaeia archaeon]|nr:hypothetical protein [Candidatus Nanoarchaeia archaeon]
MVLLTHAELRRRYGLNHVSLNREANNRGFFKEMVSARMKIFRDVSDDALQEDADTLTMGQLEEKYGLSWPTIRRELKSRGIVKVKVQRPREQVYTRQQRVRDDCILEGLSLEGIASAEARILRRRRVGAQAIDMYLTRNGLKDLWYEAKAVRACRDGIKDISNILGQVIVQVTEPVYAKDESKYAA